MKNIRIKDEDRILIYQPLPKVSPMGRTATLIAYIKHGKKYVYLLVLAGLLSGCSGCASRGARYPLQPGEKIIFESAERAEEFRRISGNEFNPLVSRTNRIVKIEGVTIIESH